MKLNRRKFIGLVAAVPLAGLAAKCRDNKVTGEDIFKGAKYLQDSNRYFVIAHPTAERDIIEQAQASIAREVAVKIDKLIRGSL